MYIYIYIYKMPYRLSPQKLCGKSCTWTHDESYIMCPSTLVATKPLWR